MLSYLWPRFLRARLAHHRCLRHPSSQLFQPLAPVAGNLHHLDVQRYCGRLGFRRTGARRAIVRACLARAAHCRRRRAFERLAAARQGRGLQSAVRQRNTRSRMRPYCASPTLGRTLLACRRYVHAVARRASLVEPLRESGQRNGPVRRHRNGVGLDRTSHTPPLTATVLWNDGLCAGVANCDSPTSIPS